MTEIWNVAALTCALARLSYNEHHAMLLSLSLDASIHSKIKEK